MFWNPNNALLIIVFYVPEFVVSLKLSGTSIPSYGILGREGILGCDFDLESDSLYTLKWYKDGHEFFRFKPNRDFGQPPITVFPLRGVFVNENRSTLHQVVLEPITLESRGEYRCEISAESPSFRTLYEEKSMGIMILPQKGPKITGVHPWYNLGDNFTASCHVNRSFPEAKLSWFVNDVQIDNGACECITFESAESEKVEDGSLLYNSSTHFQFPVDSSYFRDGSLRVECKATFSRTHVVLHDTVTANVKSGLGLQYADSLSKACVQEHPLIVLIAVLCLNLRILL